MFKVLRITTIFIVLVLMAALLIIPAAAMDFSVRAVLPENQRENGSAFFDLMVSPGQKQDIVIEVNNISDAEIVVLVEVLSATTSRNGQIDYVSGGNLDESTKYSLNNIASIPANNYTIPAQSTIQVPITLTIPDEPFGGVILGSVKVLREATQEEIDVAGAVINQYAHVTAIKLVQNEDAEALVADFALGDVDVELLNYRASITANIRNLQPMIIKGVSATATIYQKGSDQAIFDYSMEDLAFAPNSVFPFSLVDEAGYGIEAGDYTAKIAIGYDGRNWDFEQDFTIVPQVAATVNEGAANQQGQARPSADAIGASGISMLGIIAIAAGAVVATAITAMIIMNARKRPTIAG